MPGGRIRCEVEFFEGGRLSHGYVVVIDPPSLDDETRELVREAVDRAVADAKAAGIADPVGALLCLLVEQTAEARAYEREAHRRGVPAL